jgi:trans-aconitate 2-methyltransferase
MADWNAALYLTFEEERTRPARDLLAQVSLQAPKTVVDLGCGPGNSTALLSARWPEARVVGIDTSDDMLATARKRLPDVQFRKADVATFRAGEPVDLIFANAVLQWVGDHEALLPRLLAQLSPGGVLAIQMPDNLDEPSHRLMRETAAAQPWAKTLGDAAAVRVKIGSAPIYYDLLAPYAASVDVWRTTYHHPLDGAEAIVTWLRSTGLKPFLDPLSEEERTAFLAAYQARIAEAYPAGAAGKALLAFPRLFIVARR